MGPHLGLLGGGGGGKNRSSGGRESYLYGTCRQSFQHSTTVRMISRLWRKTARLGWKLFFIRNSSRRLASTSSLGLPWIVTAEQMARVSGIFHTLWYACVFGGLWRTFGVATLSHESTVTTTSTTMKWIPSPPLFPDATSCRRGPRKCLAYGRNTCGNPGR